MKRYALRDPVTRTRSDAGGGVALAGLLLMGVTVLTLAGPLTASAQERQHPTETRHTLSEEELRAGVLPALTSMARFVMTVKPDVLQRELAGSERYWRGMLPFLGDRTGTVAVEVTQAWPTMPRSWVDDIDEVLPDLTEEIVAALEVEEHPVRAVTETRTGEVDPSIRGVSRGSEWRAPDGTLLASCEVVRPGGPRARDCTMSEDIEFLISIGYPIARFGANTPSMGTYFQSLVTIRGPREGPEAGPRDGTAFTLRAELRGDTWVTYEAGPVVSLYGGPRR